MTTKDEIKNRICMELQSPILQQGFEIICRENVELEKENAKLKAQIEKMRNFQNCDYQLHIIDCPIFKSGGHISCKKCPHWILQEASAGATTMYEDLCEDKEKLTKAKEIIRNLLRTLKNENSDFTFALKYTHPVLREAEQFLKETDNDR